MRRWDEQIAGIGQEAGKNDGQKEASLGNASASAIVKFAATYQGGGKGVTKENDEDVLVHQGSGLSKPHLNVYSLSCPMGAMTCFDSRALLYV